MVSFKNIHALSVFTLGLALVGCATRNFGESSTNKTNRYERDPRAIEPKYVDPRAIEPKPVDPRAIEPKPVDPRAIEPKYVDPRAIEPKYVDPRAIEPKYVDPRAIEPKYVDPRAIEPQPNLGSGSLPFSGEYMSVQQTKCSSLLEEFGQMPTNPELKTSPCRLHLVVSGSGVIAEAVSSSGATYRMSVSPSVRNNGVILKLEGREVFFQKEASGNLGVHGSQFIFLMNPR